MNSTNIVLIGFKHVGKTVLGRSLAQALQLPFIDLDEAVEQSHLRSLGSNRSIIPDSKTIVQTHGELYFRELETQTLMTVMNTTSCTVIALGGGTPLNKINQLQIQGHKIIHIIAPRELVFERIMAKGVPSFFPNDKSPLEGFNEVWEQRQEIYQALTSMVVDHHASIAETTEKLLQMVSSVRVEVSIKALFHQYPIWIGAGILNQLSTWMPKERRAVVIITDHQVKKQYGNMLKRLLVESGLRVSLLSFAPGERSKVQRTKTRLESNMLAQGFGRDTLILALGGGVVGDLAGFIAATYLRGISFIQIPTSLLAMLDSSVGGKTGIDTVQGKNLIGAYWQPMTVVTDVCCLRTLSTTHLVNGLIEAIKIFLTNDATAFDWLQQNLSRLLAYEESSLMEVIHRAVVLKSQIVQQDERDSDQRMVLNFGHTIGHALEHLSQYQLLHGYAVGLGILVESKISELMGILSSREVQIIQTILAQLNIVPSQLNAVAPEAVIQMTRVDKKTRDGKVRYVLLKQIGLVYVASQQFTHPVEDNLVKQAFAQLQSLRENHYGR